MIGAAKPNTYAVQAVRFGFIAGVLVLWELVSYSGVIFEGALPSLGKIAAATLTEFLDPGFYKQVLVTLFELAIAMSLAAVIGASLGIAMGTRVLLGQALAPYVSALGSTPKIIFLPIAIAMLGLGMESKIALGVLGGFFPIALSTFAGARDVKAVHLSVAKTFFASRWQMLTKVYLPSLRWQLIVGIRLGFGGCFVTIILAEAKVGNLGVGYVAITHYNQFRMPEMYGLLFLMFVFAAAINLWLTRVADRLER